MTKKLLGILLILLALYVAREGYFFLLDWKRLPAGTMIAEVAVGELNLQEAGEKIAAAYGQPIAVTSAVAAERAEFKPSDLGFKLHLDDMLSEADAIKQERDWWVDFMGYLIKNPIRPFSVELKAEHDVDKVFEMTALAAELMEDPAEPPHLEPNTMRFLDGKAGYSANIEPTANAIAQALYQLDERTVEMEMITEAQPAFDLQLLEQVLTDQMLTNSAVTGSLYLRDLQTGEEIHVNSDLPMSGSSIMKIPIVLETYRTAVYDNAPTFDQQKLINETIVSSGNFSANLLLDYIAGQNNAYLGADILTESMERVGLNSTFIVTPYEEPSRIGKTTLLTPANTNPEINYDPDPNMQTTAFEIGVLLTMIYECSQGGGTLLAIYPDQLSVAECQSILDILALNEAGHMIRYGIPETVRVSNKHGYAGNMHGDAGIIFSPNGAYVFAQYLTQPGTEWLVADYSFPIMWNQSRIVYNFYNNDDPNLEDPQVRSDRVRAVELAAEAAAAAEAESDTEPDSNATETTDD